MWPIWVEHLAPSPDVTCGVRAAAMFMRLLRWLWTSVLHAWSFWSETPETWGFSDSPKSLNRVTFSSHWDEFYCLQLTFLCSVHSITVIFSHNHFYHNITVIVFYYTFAGHNNYIPHGELVHVISLAISSTVESSFLIASIKSLFIVFRSFNWYGGYRFCGVVHLSRFLFPTHHETS